MTGTKAQYPNPPALAHRGESFDCAQDRESFDLAQDREPAERPVEPY
jgi:hypothetical protein